MSDPQADLFHRENEELFYRAGGAWDFLALYSSGWVGFTSFRDLAAGIEVCLRAKGLSEFAIERLVCEYRRGFEAAQQRIEAARAAGHATVPPSQPLIAPYEPRYWETPR
jgi:hypothetical protein